MSKFHLTDHTYLQQLPYYYSASSKRPPPPDRLFEVDNSVTKMVPIRDDTFSDSPRRDLSNTTPFDADILLDVEIPRSKSRSGGDVYVLTRIKHGYLSFVCRALYSVPHVMYQVPLLMGMSESINSCVRIDWHVDWLTYLVGYLKIYTPSMYI